jgi:hypothetical protein
MSPKQQHNPNRPRPAGVGTPVPPPSFNVGVRLYQKGIKRMEERERVCREIRAEEERRIEEELIFHPQLVTRGHY